MATTEVRAQQVLSHLYRIDCPFGDGGMVHVYYLDTPEPALIDTGIRTSPRGTIGPALAAAGFALGDVRHVFNTHGHWDHMGGNGALRGIAPQARTYVHREDLALMADITAHTGGYFTYPARIMNDRQLLRQQQEMLRSNIDCPVPVDTLVDDGQAFDLGGGSTIRAIHTPGHSLGSTSYLFEPAGALFTGDGVQGLGSRPGQLPLVFEDSRAYRATIARLAEVPMEALCMGHSFCGLSPASGRDPLRRGTAARTFLEESGEAAKAIEEAMRSTLQTHNSADGRDFLAVARQTLARIAGPLSVELDATGLSVRSLAALHAFYREMTGAQRPV